MSFLESEHLDLLGTEIPVKKTYEFSGQTYVFDFKENEAGFFTLEIYDVNTNEFLYSNKIVYGQPLIDTRLGPFSDLIIPLNLNRFIAGEGITTITRQTLGNEIKLYTSIVETLDE